VKTFEEIWSNSETITGSFDKREAEAVYNRVKDLGEDNCVVEIGSYLGRSSSVIGQVAKDKGFMFYCIDPFVETDIEDFKKNMRNVDAEFLCFHETSVAANVQWKNGTYPKIDFLLVDGGHHYPEVRNDCLLWLTLLVDGGTVAFHDYQSSWHGVKRAVDKYVTGSFGYNELVVSMKMFRKYND